MNTNRSILYALLVFLLFGQGQPVFAVQVSQKSTHDFQNWDAVYLNVPITEKLSTTLELQNRIQNNWANESTLFIRPSINYNLTPRLSLTQGYSWDPNFTLHQPRFHNEQRLWQQVQYTHPLKHHFDLTLRTRLEERFIAGTTGTGVRVRQMVRLTHPIPFLNQKKYYFAAYDELFVNLNTVNSNTVGGIDQNRTFVGAGRRFSSGISLETGYLLDYNHKVYSPNKIIHAILFTLNFTPPGGPLFKQQKSKKANATVSPRNRGLAEAGTIIPTPQADRDTGARQY